MVGHRRLSETGAAGDLQSSPREAMVARSERAVESGTTSRKGDLRLERRGHASGRNRYTPPPARAIRSMALPVRWLRKDCGRSLGLGDDGVPTARSLPEPKSQTAWPCPYKPRRRAKWACQRLRAVFGARAKSHHQAGRSRPMPPARRSVAQGPPVRWGDRAGEGPARRGSPAGRSVRPSAAGRLVEDVAPIDQPVADSPVKPTRLGMPARKGTRLERIGQDMTRSVPGCRPGPRKAPTALTIGKSAMPGQALRMAAISAFVGGPGNPAGARAISISRPSLGSRPCRNSGRAMNRVADPEGRR